MRLLGSQILPALVGRQEALTWIDQEILVEVEASFGPRSIESHHLLVVHAGIEGPEEVPVHDHHISVGIAEAHRELIRLELADRTLPLSGLSQQRDLDHLMEMGTERLDVQIMLAGLLEHLIGLIVLRLDRHRHRHADRHQRGQETRREWNVVQTPWTSPRPWCVKQLAHTPSIPGVPAARSGREGTVGRNKATCQGYMPWPEQITSSSSSPTRTSLALEPSEGPRMPASWSWSTMRAARPYPIFKRR